MTGMYFFCPFVPVFSSLVFCFSLWTLYLYKVRVASCSEKIYERPAAAATFLCVSVCVCVFACVVRHKIGKLGCLVSRLWVGLELDHMHDF